jgi:cysteine synthase A
MVEAGEKGSIVTLACDPGDRYLTTYHADGWLRENGHDLEPYLARMRAFYTTGGSI